MISEEIETDVLIIGGGLAGAFAGIKAKEFGAKKVTLVSKGKLGKDSISTFAAGVFQSYEPEEDKEALLKRFALSDWYGAGLHDEEWLKITLDEAFERQLEMDKWGVQWEKTAEGKFERKEMRWSLRKAMFHGPQMMEAMARKVVESGVEVIGHTMVTDLLTEDGKPGERVVGAVGFNVRTGDFKVFRAKCTVLAAGGCGFKARFSCHKFQTGESCAAAYRAGAELGGFEIGEIFMTTAADFDTHGMNMFIGLGGKFVNAKGEKFMREYDPELEDRASMARVSESSALEVRAGRGPIYLDMTHFGPDDLKKLKIVLPIPFRILERSGVIVGDRVVKKVEWAPAFYGTIASGGGVRVNKKCEASLPGLYACGDAMIRRQHDPKALHGAAVTGARAGRFSAEHASKVLNVKIDSGQVGRLKTAVYGPLEKVEGIEPDHVILGVQEVLIPYEITLISRGDRLERAIREVERIRDEDVPLLHASDPHYLRLANEAKSMVLVAEMYLRSRLLRKESRDSCVREDFPYTDNVNWLKWTLLKQEGGQMRLWTEDISMEKYKVKPERRKYLYPVFEVAAKRGVKWG